MMDWAFQFFNHSDYLNLYSDMTNPYRTQIELDFCERVLGWSQEQTSLDAPCGAGRHSLELAGMGYRVIGLDFSDYLLQQAQNRWKVTRVSPEYPAFVQGNLLTLPFQPNSFDHIICLFTSFGYGDNLEENLQVLREFHRVLKPGGKALIDVMNRLYIVPLLNRVYQSVQNGLRVREERTITNHGRRLHNVITVWDQKNHQRQYLYNPWMFNGWELSWMANQVGLKTEAIYGDFQGKKYHEDSERAMLVAVKEG